MPCGEIRLQSVGGRSRAGRRGGGGGRRGGGEGAEELCLYQAGPIAEQGSHLVPSLISR